MAALRLEDDGGEPPVRDVGQRVDLEPVREQREVREEHARRRRPRRRACRRAPARAATARRTQARRRRRSRPRAGGSSPARRSACGPPRAARRSRPRSRTGCARGSPRAARPRAWPSPVTATRAARGTSRGSPSERAMLFARPIGTSPISIGPAAAFSAKWTLPSPPARTRRPPSAASIASRRSSSPSVTTPLTSTPVPSVAATDRVEHELGILQAGRARVDRNDRAMSDADVGHTSNLGPSFTISSDIRPGKADGTTRISAGRWISRVSAAGGPELRRSAGTSAGPARGCRACRPRRPS